MKRGSQTPLIAGLSAKNVLVGFKRACEPSVLFPCRYLRQRSQFRRFFGLALVNKRLPPRSNISDPRNLNRICPDLPLSVGIVRSRDVRWIIFFQFIPANGSATYPFNRH